MVLVSNFRSYYEYCNGGQNNVQKITGFNIDGELEMDSAFDYATRRPTARDLHPAELGDSTAEIESEEPRF